MYASSATSRAGKIDATLLATTSLPETSVSLQVPRARQEGSDQERLAAKVEESRSENCTRKKNKGSRIKLWGKWEE